MSLLRERKVALFLSLGICLPALFFLCPAQTMNREFGGVSCRLAAVVLLESLSYKWRTWAGAKLMSYWWLIAADGVGGKKNDSSVNWAISQKRIHHFGREINGVHPAALLAGGQQSCSAATGWGVSLCHRVVIYIFRWLAHLFPQSKCGCMICYFLFFIKF